MLIQALATGVNNVIEKWTGRRLPGIWENPSRGSCVYSFIQYHKTCDAIEGGIVGLTAPYMLGLNEKDRLLTLTIYSVTAVAGASFGAMAGAARAVRILRGIDFAPFHRDSLTGLVVGAAIGSISGEPRITAIWAATGTVLGTLIMTARVAKHLADKYRMSLAFSKRG